MRACRGGWSLALVACATFGWASPAAAQTVYRCGPDGRSYSHQPCPGGRALQADDARTPSQQKEAEAATGREAVTARALESHRRRDEAVAARTGPAGFRTAPVNRAEGRPVVSKHSSKASKKIVKKAPAKAPRPRPKSAV